MDALRWVRCMQAQLTLQCNRTLSVAAVRSHAERGNEEEG